MVRTRSLVRWLAAISAICLVVATLLFLGLAQDVFVAKPVFPDSADLPTRLLGSIDARHASWPFDFVSSVLFAVALGAIALLGRLLAALGPGGDGRGNLMASALFGGGLLGVASQLIHVGSQQMAVDVAYCDCGFKVQETISQAWGLTLIQGAESWLVNGAIVLIAIGVAIAGVAFAGVVQSASWRAFSWLTALVALLAVVTFGLELGGDLNQWLIAFVGGILLPLWLVLLIRGLRPAASGEPSQAAG